MSATASPSPTTYDISRFRDGWAVLEVYNNGLNRSIVERGFDCEAAAEHHADELAAAEREEAAALALAEAEYEASAYQDELTKLYDLIDTRQSTAWGDEIEARARHRAVTAALAAIDALSQKAA